MARTHRYQYIVGTTARCRAERTAVRVEGGGKDRDLPDYAGNDLAEVLETDLGRLQDMGGVLLTLCRGVRVGVLCKVRQRRQASRSRSQQAVQL
jgi:hypothetical protein